MPTQVFERGVRLTPLHRPSPLSRLRRNFTGAMSFLMYIYLAMVSVLLIWIIRLWFSPQAHYTSVRMFDTLLLSICMAIPLSIMRFYAFPCTDAIAVMDWIDAQRAPDGPIGQFEYALSANEWVVRRWELRNSGVMSLWVEILSEYVNIEIAITDVTLAYRENPVLVNMTFADSLPSKYSKNKVLRQLFDSGSILEARVHITHITLGIPSFAASANEPANA